MSFCKDKVAVVTGAGGTLCSCIAEDLAKKGAKVVLIGRTREKLEKTAEKIRGGSRSSATADAQERVPPMMPEIHPLDVCVPFNLGGYEILPLPGNHWTGKPHEQALIYKVTKRCRDGAVRLLYATDTSGLMSTVFFHGCRKDAPLTAVIMESTGNPVQKFGGMNISHSTASTVNDIFTTYLKPGKGHYMPNPGQPVYLTHIGYYEWGQRTFDEQLPAGLKLAHDGLEVLFRPSGA